MSRLAVFAALVAAFGFAQPAQAAVSLSIPVVVSDGNDWSYVYPDQDVIYTMPSRDAGTIAHETFHVIDHHLDAEWRQRYLTIMGQTHRGWRADGGNSPHEQAAEWFRFMTRFPHIADTSHSWARFWRRSMSINYGWRPTRGQYAALSPLYHELAARYVISYRWG